MQVYCNQVKQQVPEVFLKSATHLATREYIDERYHNISYNALVTLNTEVVKTVGNFERTDYAFRSSIREAKELEALVNPSREVSESLGFKFKRNIWPKLCFWIGVLFTLLSLILVFAEVSMTILPRSNDFLSSISNSYVGPIFMNCFLLTMLFYFAYTTYYGLFHIKIFGVYSLHTG